LNRPWESTGPNIMGFICYKTARWVLASYPFLLAGGPGSLDEMGTVVPSVWWCGSSSSRSTASLLCWHLESTIYHRTDRVDGEWAETGSAHGFCTGGMGRRHTETRVATFYALVGFHRIDHHSQKSSQYVQRRSRSTRNGTTLILFSFKDHHYICFHVVFSYVRYKHHTHWR
jgi:hypothetical protein